MKIVTLLGFAILLSFQTFAQTGSAGQNGTPLGKYPNTNGKTPETVYTTDKDMTESRPRWETERPRSLDLEIAQVNRDFDARIAEIRNHPKISDTDKERGIRKLEAERGEALRRLDRQANRAADARKAKAGEARSEDKRSSKAKKASKEKATGGKGGQGRKCGNEY